MDSSIGERFFELCVAAHKSCRVTLKDKLLFLLRKKPVSPPEIIETLSVEKSNLANLALGLCRDGLIERRNLSHDRRQIEYRLTVKGADYINQKLSAIEKEFNNFLTEQEEYSAAKEKIDEVIGILSFMK